MHMILRSLEKKKVIEIMATKVYGVAVIGLGIAGRVRVRDLLEQTSHGSMRWNLQGFVSRRNLEVDGTAQLTEDEVFSNPDIHTVIVCTENALHEKLVRRGLESGKHVLCEFPVALSSTVARELYGIAEKRGLILHAENIGLLNKSKEKLEAAQVPWTHGEISLKGRYNGWVEDQQKSGLPFISNVSLIETAIHLCGDVTAVGGNYTEDDSSFTAVAKLKTKHERTITITLSRSKDCTQRQKTIELHLEDGSKIDLNEPRPPGTKPGLFMQDYINFMQEVHNGVIDLTSKMRTVRALEIAEDVHRIIMPKP